MTVRDPLIDVILLEAMRRQMAEPKPVSDGVAHRRRVVLEER